MFPMLRKLYHDKQTSTRSAMVSHSPNTKPLHICQQENSIKSAPYLRQSPNNPTSLFYLYMRAYGTNIPFTFNESHYELWRLKALTRRSRQRQLKTKIAILTTVEFTQSHIYISQWKTSTYILLYGDMLIPYVLICVYMYMYVHIIYSIFSIKIYRIV